MPVFCLSVKSFIIPSLVTFNKSDKKETRELNFNLRTVYFPPVHGCHGKVKSGSVTDTVQILFAPCKHTNAETNVDMFEFRNE